jgi:hypothetical protein
MLKHGQELWNGTALKVFEQTQSDIGCPSEKIIWIKNLSGLRNFHRGDFPFPVHTGCEQKN